MSYKVDVISALFETIKGQQESWKTSQLKCLFSFYPLAMCVKYFNAISFP